MKSIKNILGISSIILLVLLVSSCAKEEPTNNSNSDTEKPTITWLKNIAALIPLNTTVQINFRIDDNVALRSVALTVTNTTSDSVYLIHTELSDQKSVTVDKSIVTKIPTTMADFVIKVDTEDKAGNKAQFLKSFHAMN